MSMYSSDASHLMCVQAVVHCMLRSSGLSDPILLHACMRAHETG